MYIINIQIVFFIALLVFTSTFGTSKKCYWNSECKYKYFSSKTPYNCVRGDIRDSKVKIKGCEPISIWTVIRHGKRSPGIDYSRMMLDALVIRDYVVASYMRGNSSLCAQDVENLRNWEVDTKLFENTYGLTDDGYQEILGIGKRLREAYSELLTDLDDGSYCLRPAFGHWVEDGVDGFVKGVANKSLLVEKAKPQYDIMAPYEACSKYILGVRRNPKTFYEADKYEESHEYNATKIRIQKRLGIQYVLTNKNITALYDLCRYTWSDTDNKGSPWCALFTKEDFDIIEYHSDLRHYYRNGYGTLINEKFGEIIAADLYRAFVLYKSNNSNKKKLTTYFSHATMMDMLYTAVGLFKDKDPLTSAHRDPDRKWRSTVMCPFAANLIAVLHRCSTHGEEDYKVAFYANEKLLTTMCENGVCSWQKFENKFKVYLNATINFCFT